MVLVPNPDWDAATDPLAVGLGEPHPGQARRQYLSIQRAIDQQAGRPVAGQPRTQARVAALRADPELGRRLSVNPRPAWWFLTLGTHREAGAIADVRVRQAVNYAIDKVAYRDADQDGTPPPASWPLPSWPRVRSATAPTTCTRPRVGGATRPRPRPCWLRPALQRGDPGVRDLRQRQPGGRHGPIQESLARAGIDLKVKTYEGNEVWFRVVAVPAQRWSAGFGYNAWCPDYPGDNGRGTIVPQYDGRLLDPNVGANTSDYQPGRQPADRPGAGRGRPGPPGGPVERDRPADHPRRPPGPAYLGEPGVPLGPPGPRRVYERWTSTPDLTAPWLGPPSPDRGATAVHPAPANCPGT